MSMRINLSIRLLTVLGLFGLMIGCSGRPISSPEKTPLVVFAAGSLIIPFDNLEKGFEERHPDIDLKAEYHGSIQVIRHATELHEPIDVIATADASLLPMLMYETRNPETGERYTDWSIRFAGNRLAIACTPDSLYADEITINNWFEILNRPDVKVGLSDPRFDAVGYRALMVYALAGEVYDRPEIFHEMFNGKFSFPLGIFVDGDTTIVTVPEILETKKYSNILVRGASVELIALLESGEIDYAFEYESVIRQHDLQMIELPASLNLGDENYAQFYSSVIVDEDFQRFSSVQPVFRGEQIGYGITIPSNAPHREAAELFIAYLLSPEGRKLMEEDYQVVFDPVTCDNIDATPDALRSYCQPFQVE